MNVSLSETTNQKIRNQFTIGSCRFSLGRNTIWRSNNFGYIGCKQMNSKIYDYRPMTNAAMARAKIDIKSGYQMMCVNHQIFEACCKEMLCEPEKMIYF